MRSKAEIVSNWLPRYTGLPLEAFGEHILLTNFGGYLDTFADLATGTTLRGPQRDDFGMLFAGKDASDYASEGQQRLLVLALCLARLQREAEAGRELSQLLNELIGSIRALLVAKLDSTTGGDGSLPACGQGIRASFFSGSVIASSFTVISSR